MRLYAALALAYLGWVDGLTSTPYQGKPSTRREILLHTGGLVVAAPTVLAYPSSSSSAETSLVPKVKAGRVTMSKTIQGYWQLAGGHGKYDIENVQRVMKDHVAAGENLVPLLLLHPSLN